MQKSKPSPAATTTQQNEADDSSLLQGAWVAGALSAPAGLWVLIITAVVTGHGVWGLPNLTQVVVGMIIAAHTAALFVALLSWQETTAPRLVAIILFQWLVLTLLDQFASPLFAR